MKKQSVSDLITKEKFSNSLKSLPQNKVVGRSSCEEHCPLANYILQNTTVLGVSVRYYTIEYKSTNKGKWHIINNLPKWVSNFITEIDNTGFTKVSAKRALSILESV